jgi:hypothetical protein
VPVGRRTEGKGPKMSGSNPLVVRTHEAWLRKPNAGADRLCDFFVTEGFLASACVILRSEFCGISQDGWCLVDVSPWGSSLRMHGSRTRIYSIELQRISEALISSGCSTLDKQAKALGLRRSTAWTIIRNKHKLGRLSAKTIGRILKNPETPPNVRTVIQEYVAERFTDIRRTPEHG